LAIEHPSPRPRDQGHVGSGLGLAERASMEGIARLFPTVEPLGDRHPLVMNGELPGESGVGIYQLLALIKRSTRENLLLGSTTNPPNEDYSLK